MNKLESNCIIKMAQTFQENKNRTFIIKGEISVPIGALKKNDEKKFLLNFSTTKYQSDFKNNENKKLKNVYDYDHNSSSDKYQYDDAIVTVTEAHSSSIAEPTIPSNPMNDYYNELAQNNNGFNSNLINIEPQPSILRNQTEVESATATRVNINPRATFGQFLVNENNKNNNWSDNETKNIRSNLIEESNWPNPHSLILDMINESKWNNCKNLYGGETKEKKVDGNWKYKTNVFNSMKKINTVISEKLFEFDQKIFWKKTIVDLNTKKVILELSYFDKNNKLRQVYKLYNDENLYLIDLQKLNFSYLKETFTPVKQSKTIWQQNNNWYEILTTWSSNILHDSKKVLQGGGYLTAVIGIRTIQRAFTVIVNDKGEMDWEKLIKKINPKENPIEFGFSLPQSLFSVFAMNVWKWGLTNIINEIKKLTTISRIRTTDASDNEINNDNQTHSNNWKGIFKWFLAKLGYWVPNHFMITCSSMYSDQNLTSGLAYLEKIKSGWNILSTFIRAEVLCFMFEFLKDGLAKFSETHLFTNIKPHIISLFEKLKNLQICCNQERSQTCEVIMILLKIIAYLSIMIGTTIIDNANKTALNMWTDDKLDEFVSTFVTWEMAVIIIGLISVDTFGNKYCNVQAKKELYKLWNVLKEQRQLVVSTNQANIINGDIETPVDTITDDNLCDNEKEKELIQKFASEEAHNTTTYGQLLNKFDLSYFFVETENQSQAFNLNWINDTSLPLLPTNKSTNLLIIN